MGDSKKIQECDSCNILIKKYKRDNLNICSDCEHLYYKSCSCRINKLDNFLLNCKDFSQEEREDIIEFASRF